MGANCCSEENQKLGGAFGDNLNLNSGQLEMVPYTDDTLNKNYLVILRLHRTTRLMSLRPLSEGELTKDRSFSTSFKTPEINNLAKVISY